MSGSDLVVGRQKAKIVWVAGFPKTGRARMKICQSILKGETGRRADCLLCRLLSYLTRLSDSDSSLEQDGLDALDAWMAYETICLLGSSF